MDNVITQHITKTPGICGGRACIAGHRVRVMDIVGWHIKRGYSVAQVAEMFPSITLGDIYAALAYYHDRKEEIESDFRNDEEWARWAEASCPSLIPRQLKEGLRG